MNAAPRSNPDPNGGKESLPPYDSVAVATTDEGRVEAGGEARLLSHRYDFRLADLARLAGLPLLPVVLFAGLMHVGAALQWWPDPRPTLDVDRTILVHQAEASRSPHDAELLLLGDSSCLMDVSATELGRRLETRALNLGTLSYVDLPAQASLLRSFAAANPGRPRVVVLLMHPEALRRGAAEGYHSDFLRHYPQDLPEERVGGVYQRLYRGLGLKIFRERLWSRLVPAPLPGAYGRRYGFSADLEKHLTAHGGSAIDPETVPFEGNAEYRLARRLEPASRAFKVAVPPGVKLLVGITPVPARFAGPRYPERYRQMLQEWSQWLEAEALPLPATLPDHLFARVTHLNEAGIPVFSAALAEALAPHWTPRR